MPTFYPTTPGPRRCSPAIFIVHIVLLDWASPELARGPLQEEDIMTGFAVRTADERREQIQKDAAAKGIDETYISTLVETFYSRIRQDPELGPIFDRVIGGKWDAHLRRMKDFWASVALNAGRYSGKPVPAHKKLEGVTREHFTNWLALFEATLDDTAPSPEAVSHFMERAVRIAESLQLAMFGLDRLTETKGATRQARNISLRGEES